MKKEPCIFANMKAFIPGMLSSCTSRKQKFSVCNLNANAFTCLSQNSFVRMTGLEPVRPTPDISSGIIIYHYSKDRSLRTICRA